MNCPMQNIAVSNHPVEKQITFFCSSQHRHCSVSRDCAIKSGHHNQEMMSDGDGKQSRPCHVHSPGANQK